MSNRFRDLEDLVYEDLATWPEIIEYHLRKDWKWWLPVLCCCAYLAVHVFAWIVR